MEGKFVFDGNYYSEKHSILEVDNQKVFLKNQNSKVTWYFNYATDQRGHTMKSAEGGGLPDVSHNCRYDKKLVKAAINKLNNLSSSSSGSTDDKIAQAKQICKDLGFKTKTEKFADCSLKMLSMQFEVQNREALSGGGTQQKIVVNQGYSVGDAMIALSGIISDANNVRSSYGGGNCRIFQHAYHASLKCN